MFFTKSIKLIASYFFPILLLVLGVLIFSKKEQLMDMGRVVSSIKPIWLLAAILLQGTTYFAEAKAYISILKIWRKSARMKGMVRRIIISRFVGRSLPAFSVAGSVYIAKKFRDDGLTRNDVIQTVLMSTLNQYMAILVFTSFSYVYLSTNNKLTTLETIFFLLFTILTVGMFAIVYLGNKKHGKLGLYYQKMVDKFHSVVNNFLGSENGNSKNKNNHDKSSEKSEVDSVPLFLPRTLFWQIVKFFIDSITVFLIFVGFSEYYSFSIVTVGFAVATVFGIISFFPGGLGQFEAAQILVYSSLGVPVQVAIAVTLTYRLLSFWLPIPVGAYLYKKQGRKSILLKLRKRKAG